MSKAKRYWREIRLTWNLGANFSSRLRLICATLYFHLYNGLGRVPPPNEKADAYQLKLGSQNPTVHLRTRSGDLFVFYEIFLDECYRLPPHVSNVENVVDLGANIGLATLYYARQFPTARFVCVEPLPANVSLLRQNTAMLGGRVEIVQGAVSASSEMLTFAPSPWSYSGKADASASLPLRVQAYTLAEIFQAANLEQVDLLKIDVEGAERALFANAPTWLEHVKLIIIELHDNAAWELFEQAVTRDGLRAIPPLSVYDTPLFLALRPQLN